MAKEMILWNCFLSSLDDLGYETESDIANIIEKIDQKIEDIGTDIYHASLPAEAL